MKNLNPMKYFVVISLIAILFACNNEKELSYTIKDDTSYLSEDNASMNAGPDEDYFGDYPPPPEPGSEIYNPSRTLYNDLVHTKLEVNFDWTNARLNGKATITAKPHFYETDSLTLDAKGMDIKGVSLNGKSLNYSYDSSQIRIKLDKKYTRTENYSVVVDYVSRPNDRALSGSAAITSDKGLYFINPKGEDKGKMPQIWTQGETEANSVWFPTIDSPNAKTTQEILMTVDDKYTTLSNGKLVSSKKNTDGTRTDHWKQDLAHAPYLFMMAVGEFKVVKDFYTRPDGSKMEVNYYVEPKYEQYAKAIFGETPAMIKHFSQLLGVEYPWDKYHQIVVRDYVSGAMENTGAVIFGDYVYKTDRELLDGNDQSTIAHELFHHWFGDYVTCESWANLPLNESFANYSQYLWDEFRYGLDEANYQAEQEAQGYYNSTFGNHHDLINYSYYDKEDMFDGHSYNKGGRILHMLRNYMGDAAFFKGLNVYLTQNKYKAAEVHNLRLAFEEVSGEDLNWFFNQWFLGKGHPVIQVYHTDNHSEKTVELNVLQKQKLSEYPLYKLPVSVLIHDDKGKRVEKITITEANQSFTFTYSGKLRNVIFDANQVLLGSVYNDKPFNQFIDQYQPDYTYKLRAEALKYAVRREEKTCQQVILDALNDPFWNIRKIAIENSSKLSGTFLDQAKQKIQNLASNDPKSSVRSAALTFISKNLDEDKQNQIYIDRIDKDQSYSVQVTALSNLSSNDKENGLKKAAELIAKDKTEKILVAVSEVYGQHGTEENFSFFESIFINNKFSGFDELNVLGGLLNLCYNTNSKVIEKTYTIIEYLRKEGNSSTQMYFSRIVEYTMDIISQKIEAENQKLEQTESASEKQAISKEIEELERLYTIYSQMAQE
jgi:aminopeptidase N